jgi:hypothetical protein
MFNGLTAVVVGAYLIAVAYNGNGMSLLAALKQDKRFLQWLIAVAILYLLWRNPRTKSFVGPFIIMAAAGGLVVAAERGTLQPALAKIKTLWAQLGS